MSEIIAAKRWIKSLLSADAELAALVETRIFSTVIPQQVSYPVVLISTQSALDQNSAYGYRTGSRLLLQVKAVTQERNLQTAEAISSRIEAILQGQKATLDTFKVQNCLRQQEIDYPEFANGKQYNHLGGIYAVQTNLI